ncbi:NitT/TauT family transport system substrate-binding protein [Desulfobaculum xiamenense]|uniref:NitT/TauT family transport system substrate-binding protein n=1 Tax=Desulfobaculum xiamenense TaxID=995050 RepID=A0A846QFV4_9BACT|nr:ABC transporter substrate-binding protein [Desulfobaculum xiamenense]NJB67198.1 NitT/TauT family transport system substrate-binding protein [Desulfobaculum xiamenense]
MHRTGILCLAIMIVGLLAGSADAQPRKVVISGGSGAMDGAVCVAIAKGYLAENDIDAELRIYRNGSAALEGFLAGEADFVSTNRVGVVLTDFDPSRFAFIATLSTSDSQTKVLCRKSAGIAQPADLRGKRIGTVRGTTAHYYLHKFLIHNGVSPRDVKVVYLKKKQLPEALVAGEIDAMCQHGTPFDQAKSALGDDAIIFGNPKLDRKLVPLMARRDMIANEPKVIEGLFRGIRKAELWIADHQEEASRIIADMRHLSYESTLAFLRNEADFNLSLEQSVLLNLENVEMWAIESELVERKTPRNMLDIVDYHPLEKVFPESVTIIR